MLFLNAFSVSQGFRFLVDKSGAKFLVRTATRAQESSSVYLGLKHLADGVIVSMV